jgi:phytoene synthase
METLVKSEKEIIFKIFEEIDFEKIIDHPNILIAANFWDEEKYQAARTCYRFMRYIDDFIDNYKSENQIVPENIRAGFETHVNQWIQSVIQPDSTEILFPEITETIRKFKIPSWPMEDFAKSMIYDIYNDGFPTLDAFIDYAQGASVAPAAVFVHLCGLKQINGQFQIPDFDVKEAAMPCAIFSYLVHIIRDFVKDHTHNLNYFPEDLMIENGLNRENLLEMAQGAPLSSGFKKMIAELYTEADKYRLKTIQVMQEIAPHLDFRSRLSIEIIFSLYTMVFERIDVDKGNFTTEELNPTASEIKERVKLVIESIYKS